MTDSLLAFDSTSQGSALVLYKTGWFHRKNEEGLGLLEKEGLARVKLWDGEQDGILLCSDEQLSKLSKHPKVIFGPHFAFRNTVKIFSNYQGPKKIVFNALSPWLVSLIGQYVDNPLVQVIPIPFPVNVNRFVPGVKDDSYFVYFKHLDNYRLEEVLEMLKSFVLGPQKIFIYGNYREEDFLKAIATCKFGIWVDAHESQGFAFQEAMSADCPLFVSNSTDMTEELDNFKRPWGDWTMGPLPCTSASYFDETCGIIRNKGEDMAVKFQMFLNGVDGGLFKPREFVLGHLTTKHFVDRIKSITFE